ncbi:SMI1/KNR4 family protein [Zobellia uliginosa]|uniref:SMI1/KNR4 family protein n=1 Tax=Zobellia uliginosa TaxID=143224 RepID=UPI001C072F6A|nr:SMI1/KNR4 family protein [Zobellia uliginosa]MBU2947036.1 SMI1/KNR4 family protein [Zobellia uliginosa]
MTNWNEIIKLYNISEKENEFGYRVDEINEVESRLKTKIPQTLKSYYLSLGKNENINNSHNRLLKPNQEIGFSDDGYLVFYEENQASAYWGVKQEDLKLDNPPVWGNYGTNESPDWHLETNTIENFLLLMGVYNGTLGGLEYNANCFENIEPDTVKKIQEIWKEIDKISWEKQRIYTIDFEEVISLSFDQNNNCTAIFIGTSHRERFDNLLENLNINNWSYTSFEDDYE